MFVLLQGAVGRILSLFRPPPHAAPRPRLVPSCKRGGGRGGSEQPLTCSALPGLLQEQVFPGSVSPAQDRCPPHAWEAQGCPKGSHPTGQALHPPFPISAPPQSPIPVLPLGMWHLKPPGVRMGGS